MLHRNNTQLLTVALVLRMLKLVSKLPIVKSIIFAKVFRREVDDMRQNGIASLSAQSLTLLVLSLASTQASPMKI